MFLKVTHLLQTTLGIPIVMVWGMILEHDLHLLIDRYNVSIYIYRYTLYRYNVFLTCICFPTYAHWKPPKQLSELGQLLTLLRSLIYCIREPCTPSPEQPEIARI